MSNHTQSTNKDLEMFSTFYENRMRPERKAALSIAHPDADAFQKLCCDLLATEFKEEFPNMNLSKFPTSGADGAIDFSGKATGPKDEDHFKLIGECKKNESLESAKKQRDILIDRLREHIRKPNAVNTLYAPWLDPKLRRYVYCTSCNIDTQKGRDDITKPIHDVLLELSKEPHLEHLKIVADNIVLYTWNDLLPLLEKNRNAYHKWVKYDYPAGVEPLIFTIKLDQPQYKDYLSSEKQPYFSRDDYVKQNTEAKDLVTETGILNDLLDKPAFDGCILYGEGGIGKTRLMLELGSIATKQEWIVFRVTDKNPDRDQLKTMFYPGYRYLLLFDYIEESPLFDDPEYFRKITHPADGAKVKIIGNCRKTHFDNSQLIYAEGFFSRDLSIKDKQLQQEYKDYVVKHILGDLVRFFKVDESFYRLKPAFAVFLKFLDKKYPIQESDIRGENAFRYWLQKQLYRTFGLVNIEELSNQEEFFHIFFILSSSTGVPLEPLTVAFKKIITSLLKDGWIDIEEVNGQKEIKINHDTIAEEVLILRLRDCKELLEEEIKSIFNFAITYNGLENCLRLFERISDWVHDPELGDPGHLKKNSKIFYRFFSDEIASYPGYWSVVKKALTISPLMDEPDVVKLIRERSLFFEEILLSKSFGLVLASKIRYLHKNKDWYSMEIREKVNRQLHDLLKQWRTVHHDFFNYLYISARILEAVTVSIGVSGEWEPGVSMETKVKEWLNRYSLEMETSYVLKSWLDASGEKEVVEKFVSTWLEKYSQEMDTSFVIKSWLKAGGETGVVSKFVSRWLEKYPLLDDTGFMLGSWLKVGGKREIVSPFMLPWLESFPLKEVTGFVLGSWLEAKGDKEIVSPFVPQWLASFLLKKETGFVLGSWLKAGGDREIVSQFVHQWLKSFPLEKETGFVLSLWLEAGGKTDVVSIFVADWLERYPIEKDKSYVIQSWLKAKGETGIVSKFVSRWLEKYSLKEETRFMLQYWLTAGGEPGVVLKFVLEWLERYSIKKETGLLLRLWLDAGGETDVVSEFVSGWLDRYPIEKEKSIVFQSWLKAKGETGVVSKFVSGWLEKYPLKNETCVLAKSWLKAKGEKEIVAEFVSQWLERFPLSENSDYLICAWLDAGGEKERVAKFVSPWLEKYFQKEDASFIIKAWLIAGGDKEVVSKYVFPWLQRFALKGKACHVLYGWLNAGGNPDLVRQYIKPWLELFSNDEKNAGRVIKSWRDSGGDPQEVAPFI